jgi:hypothetical protein
MSGTIRPRAGGTGRRRSAWHPPCSILGGQGIGKLTHVTRKQDGSDRGSPLEAADGQEGVDDGDGERGRHGALVAADDITHAGTAAYLDFIRDPASGYVSVASRSRTVWRSVPGLVAKGALCAPALSQYLANHWAGFALAPS